MVTYKAHVKCSSSCFRADCASRSANCDMIWVVCCSFWESDSIRSSNSLIRSLRSCSLVTSRFSRRSSSSVVIRFNRERSEPDDDPAGAFAVPSSRVRSLIETFLLFDFWPDELAAWEAIRAVVAAKNVVSRSGDRIASKKDWSHIPARSLRRDDRLFFMGLDSWFLGIKTEETMGVGSKEETRICLWLVSSSHFLHCLPAPVTRHVVI